MNFTDLPKAYIDIYNEVARVRTEKGTDKQGLVPPPMAMGTPSSSTELMWGPGVDSRVPTFKDTWSKSWWAFWAIWKDWYLACMQDTTVNHWGGKAIHRHQAWKKRGTPEGLIDEAIKTT